MSRLATLAALLLPTLAFGQPTGWLQVENGTMLYLTPYENTWMPIADRQQVPLRTYVTTHSETRATLFRDTDAFLLPAAAYFYLEDATAKDRVEMVGALTRIEAEQLPATIQEPGAPAARPLGLTYGRRAGAEAADQDIPYRQERLQAVAWFYEHERFDAALLTLKRAMTKYPQLYAETALVERLLGLYDRLALYGFLLDESERLLDVDVSEPYARLVHDWHERAQNRLIRPK